MVSKIDKELWRYCKKMQGEIEIIQERLYRLELKVFGKPKTGKMSK